MNHASSIPVMPGLPVLGVAPRLLKDPVGLLEDAFGQHGRMVFLRGVNTYLIGDADIAKHVLMNSSEFIKDAKVMEKISLVAGAGVSSFNGAQWKTRRRILTPVYRSALFGRYLAELEREWDAWSASRDSQAGAFDLVTVMRRVVLVAIIKSLFSTDVQSQVEQIMADLEVLQTVAVKRVWSVIQAPFWVPTRSNQMAKQARQRMDALISGLIDARRTCKEPGQDMLGALIAARDEDGNGLTNEDINEEILTIFFAGHDTTATASAFALHLLASNEPSQSRVRDEVRSAWASATDSQEALKNTPYLDAVISEALRLYPPCFAMSRLTTAPVDTAYGQIPANSKVLVCQWLLHRDAGYWTDPDEFIPDRFLVDPNPDAYFPFGTGSRACIGKNLARLQIGLLLSRSLKDWALSPEDAGARDVRIQLFLAPKNPLRVRVTPVRAIRQHLRSA